MPVQRGDDQLRRLLETEQRLVRVQAEVVLEPRRDLGKHLDVRAGGEELVARAAQHDHVYGIVHPRFEDARVQFFVHFVRVGVGGGIVQLEDRHPFLNPIIDQISSHSNLHFLNKVGDCTP